MQQPLIGILAGMGPRSTGPFLDLLITQCQQQYGAKDDIDFPKMMICSQPAPFYEDRPIDHAAMETAIIDGLQHLERTGADFLAIACNTAHIYYPQLAQSVSIPLLNMVNLTVNSLPDSAHKIALIAARPTAEAHIYQTALQQRGFQLADISWQSQVDHLLGVIRTTTDPTVLAAEWNKIMRLIQTTDADTIVVACLDLSGVLVHATTRLTLIDASQCLAREIVRQWLSYKPSLSMPQSSGIYT